MRLKVVLLIIIVTVQRIDGRKKKEEEKTKTNDMIKASLKPPAKAKPRTLLDSIRLAAEQAKRRRNGNFLSSVEVKRSRKKSSSHGAAQTNSMLNCLRAHMEKQRLACRPSTPSSIASSPGNQSQSDWEI